jgi:alkylhydroperoxidase/carboxymuconolactone decarboxylase family protein YurZ
LAIDRIDGTDGLVGPQRVERQRHAFLGVAAGVTRTTVMVVLASLAILVVLPAAIAAQAAAAI